jgi:hypothetical protein
MLGKVLSSWVDGDSLFPMREGIMDWAMYLAEVTAAPLIIPIW